VAENGYGISWIVPQLTTKRTKSFRRQIYGKRILFTLEAHYTSTSMEYWCRMMFLLLIKSPEIFRTFVTLIIGIIWTLTLLKQSAIL
jgi:hypothetical protein